MHLLKNLIHALFQLALISVLCYMSSVAMKAQSKTDQQPIDIKVINTFDEKILVEFEQPGTIENLLVVINDKKGNTVFLDNLYHYTGAYRKEIDLSQSGKGDYEVHLRLDRQKFDKRITIK